MEDFAPLIRSHLADLTALATGRMSGAGLTAKDSCVSIENVCRNLLDEQVAGASSLLFDKTAGLPAIIWMSMKQKERGNPSLVELRGEIMRLIEWIFDDFTGRELQHQLGEYVVEVVRTCVRLFPVETTTKNKDLTFGPLLAALEQREHVPDPHELHVLLFPPDRTLSPIEKYWDHLTKQKSAREQTETLRGQCMRFLGRLAMFFPVDVSLVPIYNNRQLYRSYEAALCQEGTGLPELAGALDGLDGLLSYIAIDRADTSKLFSSILYSLGRWVDNDDIKRYNVPRAAMRVLANHMPHFAAADLLMPSEATHVTIRENLESSLIFSSARRIWGLLHPLSLHHNAEMQHQAMETMRVFLCIFSRQLVLSHGCGPPLSDTALSHYCFFMKNIQEIVMPVGTTPRDVAGGRGGSELPVATMARAMRLLGEFSASMAVFDGADVVQRHLSDMCRYARDYLLPSASRHSEEARVSVARSLSQLPIFIEAFANMVKQVSTVDAYTISTLDALLQLLFSQFNRFLGRTIIRCAVAMQRVFVSLLNKGDALERLSSSLVGAALLISVDECAKTILGQGLEAGYVSSRKLVNELWVPALSPTPPINLDNGRTTRDPSTQFDATRERSEREEACGALVADLLRSICAILKRFDLNAVENENEPSPASSTDFHDEAAPVLKLGELTSEKSSNAVPDDLGDTTSGYQTLSLSESSRVKNPDDMTLFLSLMELCDLLLPAIDDTLLLQWAHILLIELTSLSASFPHISGFYKLVRIFLVVCERSKYFEFDDENFSGHVDLSDGRANARRCYTMISSFLEALLQRTKRFKDELLVAAMDLLLCAPNLFVSSHMPQMVSTLETALGMGHAYRPLALTALSALEAWLDTIPRHTLRPHLSALLPCLNVYLTISADKTVQEGVMQRERSARRHNTLAAKQKSRRTGKDRLRRGDDEALQLRIVSLLGRVGGESVAIVHGSQHPAVAAGRWSLKELAGFNLCLKGESDLGESDELGRGFYLDAILPRVTELATTSMTYREKAAACELFEAAIKLCIGRVTFSQDPKRYEVFAVLFRHIFPAMLKLATDADGFARKLFVPLTKQVIHWLTAKSSDDTSLLMQEMLQAIMTAIADPLQSGLREFGATCLGEFIKWSIKQNRENDSPRPIKALLDRLYGLAHHPSALQRLGFAHALNSAEVYRELREDRKTIDVHLLEMLQQTIFSLRISEADPPTIGTVVALGSVVTHLEKVMVRSMELLLKPNEQRVAFTVGIGGKQGFAHWLFVQCFQQKSHARLRSSKLFETLCSSMPSRCSSAQWVHTEFPDIAKLPICIRLSGSAAKPGRSSALASAYGESVPDWSQLVHGPPKLKASTLGVAAEDDQALIRWLEQLHACVDCVYWTLREKHLTPETILDPAGSLRSVPRAIHAFLDVLADHAAQSIGCVRSVSRELISRHLRDCLKGAFRLILKLLRGARSDRRLSIVWGEGHAADGLKVVRAALFAVLLPGKLGYDSSEADACARIRSLGCEIVDELYQRGNALVIPPLRSILSEAEANLCERLVEATERDALETLALIEGCLALHRVGRDVQCQLLRDSLPRLTSRELADKLTHQAAHAPMSLGPLQRKVMSKAVDLALTLGLPPQRIFQLISDATPVPNRSSMTLGTLFIERFRQVLLPHFAREPRIFVKPLLLRPSEVQYQPNLIKHDSSHPFFKLTIELLDYLVMNRQVPSDDVVHQINEALPGFLDDLHWPNFEWVDGVLSLFRLLLVLGDYIVLQTPNGSGECTTLVNAWASLFPGPGTGSTCLHQKQIELRATEEALKLLPLLLVRLRLPANPGSALDHVMKAVRRVIENEIPLSFHELIDEGRKRHVQALVAPLLDCISDQRVRSLELLKEVLRAPAFVEQSFDSLNRHSFSDGIISAFRSFAHAAASPGGGAAACSSERLWVAMADIIFGDGRWDTRYAALHWLVVPLAHAVKEQTLVDLLQNYMPRVASILDRCKNTAQSPLPRDTLELNSELVRRLAAFEFCAVLISRLGKQGRKELNVDGALGKAAGRNEDVFRLLAPAAGNTAKKNQSTVREEDNADSRVTSALCMQLRAAAYSALIEAVVPTQDDAGTIAKVLFKWEDLWENVVDHSKLFSLKAETDFPQTSARAQLALHAPARSRPQTGSAVSYLPSQALLASSLGQTQISQDVDARSSNNSTTRDDAQRSDRNGKVDFMVPSTLFNTSQSVVRNSQCFTQSQSNLTSIDEQDEDESITVDKTTVNNFNEEADDFELDELNCHPLMAILMRCIRKLHSRKLGGTDYKNGGMPYWLSSLHAKMNDGQSARTSHTQLNARLLIAKLIFNLRHHREEGAPDAAEVRLKRKQLLERGKTIDDISRELKRKCSSPRRIALEELREAASEYYWMEGDNLFVEKSEYRAFLIAEQPLLSKHAAHWVKPLLQVVFDSIKVEGACFHYLARDILLLVAEWKARADELGAIDPLPVGEESNLLLSNLTERLMLLCVADQPMVLKANVAVCKRLVEVWKNRLRPRRLIILKMMKKNDEKLRLTAIHLLDVLTANGMAHFDDPAWTPELDGENGEKVRYTPVLPEEMREAIREAMVDRFRKKDAVKDGTPRKKIYQSAARVLGRVMKQAKEAATTDKDEFSRFERTVIRFLSELSNNTQENLARLLVLLDSISLSYPEVLLAENGFFARVALKLLTKVYGDARVQVLNCLRRCVFLEENESSLQTADQATQFRVQLSVDALQQVLKQQQNDISLAALELVHALCERRGARSIASLFGTLSQAFDHHRHRDCRAVYQELLYLAYPQLKNGKATETEDKVDPQLKKGESSNNNDKVDDDAGTTTVVAGLLQALSDTDDRLREKAISYWHDEVLKGDLSDRLMSCFNILYAPNVEDRWLHHCGILLFRMSTSANNYEKPLFDQQLKPGVRFDPYQVRPTEGSSSDAMLPWGSQSYSQSEADVQHGTGFVRATQENAFSQTQSQAVAVASRLSTYSSQDGSASTAVRPSVPLFSEPSISSQEDSQSAYPIGQRFKPKGKLSFSPAGARRRRVADASKVARASTVIRYRTYRIGELPDIMISTRDLLAPLSALVHHDPLVAKLAFVQLYGSVRKHRSSTPELAKDKGFIKLLSSESGGPAFVACLHELIMSEASLESLPENLVADSAKRSGNLHSGVRILEKYLLCMESRHETKRARNSSSGTDDGSMRVKISLTELYGLLGEEDIVRGLAAQISQSECTRRALAAEARGDSEQALTLFEQALSRSESTSSWEVQLAKRARRGSLLLLGKWEVLRDDTQALMEEEMNKRAGRLDGPVVECGVSLTEPWVRMWVLSRCKLSHDGFGQWPAADAVGVAPHPSRDRSKLLKNGFGWMLLLDRMASDDSNGARALVPACSNAFIERWATLHPLATSARMQELRPLQFLAEISETLNLLDNKQVYDDALGWHRHPDQNRLMSCWMTRLPSEAHHDSSVWDDLLSVRQRMTHVLRQHLARSLDGRAELEDREAILSDFDRDAALCRINTLEAAARAARLQGNFGAAKTYHMALPAQRKLLGQKADVRQMCSILSLKLDCCRARYAHASDVARQSYGDYNAAPDLSQNQKLDGSARLIKELLDVRAGADKLKADDLSPSDSWEFNRLRATVALELAATDRTLLNQEGLQTSELIMSAYEMLHSALNMCAAAENVEMLALAGQRLQLADLCDQAATMGKHEPKLLEHKQEFVAATQKQVLLAMQAGSTAASNRLASILALSREHHELWAQLKEQLQLPPTWMYLSWIPQLLALLNEPHGTCITQILVDLAEQYPRAMFFPYQVSLSGLSNNTDIEKDPSRRNCLAQLKLKLLSPTLEALTAGFNDLTHPELRLTDWMKEVVDALKEKQIDLAKRSYQAFWNAVIYDGKRPTGLQELRGKLLVEFGRIIGPELEKLCGVHGEHFSMLQQNRKKFTDTIGTLVEKWKTHVLKRSTKLELSDFSLYLSSYHRANADQNDPLAVMEIPGQYTGEKPPHTSGHVLLDCVDREIKVMESLRKPKQVTLHGSDQRDVPFLVKGGEDLRLDQRVQLIFRLMNRMLAASPQSATRSLELRTYEVVPLNDNVGLIEWMSGTETLMKVIEGDEKNVAKALSKAKGQYCNFIHGNYIPSYKHSRLRVEGHFAGVQAFVQPDLLSRGVASRSTSSESYLAMRGAFCRSLASLTIASYILGIGDRHLGNFMLETATGRVVGIDFGFAFGSSTYLLPVPELMAVRLTRQMMSFMAPLNSEVLLRANMVHTLTVIRSRKADLMRVMEVFISEPLLDWDSQARKLSDDQRRSLQEFISTSHVTGPSASTQIECKTEVSSASISGSPGSSSWNGSAGVSGGTSGSHDLLSLWKTCRVESVYKKLSGVCPASITIAELRLSSQPAVRQGQNEMCEVVMGPEGSIRRKLGGPNRVLSVEQQVDCLIEQATDPSILGRTWQGWAPWL